MGQTFSYKEITQQCREIYTSESVQPSSRLQGLHRACEGLLDQYHPERSKYLACHAGCGDCCVVNVSILWPEALAIIEYLESHPHFDVQGLLATIDKIWVRIRGVDDEDRVCMRQPCVFLNGAGCCTIYPVRPLLCRGVTSTDTESCRRSFNGYLYNEKLLVEMNLFQLELYDAAYLGISEGLEQVDLDGRGFELTGLLRYLLRNRSQRAALGNGLRLSWDELA